jgi:hypothetical protein
MDCMNELHMDSDEFTIKKILAHKVSDWIFVMSMCCLKTPSGDGCSGNW